MMNNSSELPMKKDFFMLFSPKIEMDINLDYFTFKKDGVIKKVETFMYVTTNPKNTRIVSVGELPGQQEETIKTYLFQKDNNPYKDKYDILVAFINHCLTLIMSKYSVVRPSIFISGIEKLDPILCGYQKKIINDSITDAGAARVKFID